VSNGLSKVAAFILGPSAKADDDSFNDDFKPVPDEEPTDIVDIEAVKSRRDRPRAVPPAPVTSLEQRRRTPATRAVAMSEILHIRPKSFAEAAAIGESFKDGVPIILNMTSTDEKPAQKLIDFASGMAFVTDGKLERITAKVFILIPATVHFSEAEKNQLVDSQNLHD